MKRVTNKFCILLLLLLPILLATSCRRSRIGSITPKNYGSRVSFNDSLGTSTQFISPSSSFKSSLKIEPYTLGVRNKAYLGGGFLEGNNIFQNRSTPHSKTKPSEIGAWQNPKQSSFANSSQKNIKNENKHTSGLFKTKSRPILQAKIETVFSNLEFNSKISQKNDDLVHKNSVANNGDTRAVNPLKVGFLQRNIDAEYKLGLQLSNTSEHKLVSILQENPEVEIVASNTEGTKYFAKLNNSEQWLKIEKLSIEVSKVPILSDSRRFQLASFGEDSRKIQLSWVDEKFVKSRIEDGRLKQVYSLDNNEVSDDLVWVEEYIRSNYQSVPRDVTYNSTELLLIIEKHLQVRLKRIDRLRNAGNDAKALRELKQLTKIYGYTPQISIRIAISKIKLAQLNVVEVKLGASPILSNSKFLAEIENRLRGVNETLFIRRIETDNAFIYGIDHSGFNNLDWSIPIEDRVVLTSGVRVYQFVANDNQTQGIGQQKLNVSGLGDEYASSNTSTEFRGTHPDSALGRTPIRPKFPTLTEGDKCEQEQERENNSNCPSKETLKEKPVYFVMTS